MHKPLLVLLALAAWLSPLQAVAQSLVGTVRDASGGVLPGVKIDVTSPALIEKSRLAETDGAGRYRVIDLPPGIYTVAYALPGFVTIWREGVEVRSGAAVTADAEMRLGGLEQQLVVTGETPFVDPQNSTSTQVVLAGETVSALPATRAYGNILAGVPGVQLRGYDPATGVATVYFASRGGRGTEGTVRIDGMNVGGALFGGGVSPFAYDTANAREILVTVAGGLGETDRGGPQLDIIPRTGGNVFSGTVFASAAGRWSQGRNLDDELRSQGLTRPAALLENWDTSMAVGGPVVRDRLWFFANLRSVGEHEREPGAYANLNAGDPLNWAYARDETTDIRSAVDRRIGNLRLTAQVSPRQQIQVYDDYQKYCRGSALVTGVEQCRARGEDWVALGRASLAPETASVNDDFSQVTQARWSMPVSSSLLLEAGVSRHANGSAGNVVPAGALDFDPFIPIRDTGLGVTYHGFAGASVIASSHTTWRASASRVSGSHAFKIGYRAASLASNTRTAFPEHGLQYTFRSGVPLTINYRIAPVQQGNRTRYDGFYVQDAWTRGRLTVQGALRYEHAWSYFPAGQSGLVADSRWTPAFTLPAGRGVSCHDVAPRLGLAYDLFGDSRTVVRASLGQYWESASNDSVFTIANPASTYSTSASRPWVDGNRNFIPDCDLENPASQDNRGSGGDWCGLRTPLDFGGLRTATTVNPDVLRGWGVRPDEWQFGVSVARELLPRVLVEVGYNRRRWGNFFFTDNREVGPEDHQVVTLTTPTHLGLPSRGQPVSYWVRRPVKIGQLDNYYTFAEDFGDVTYYWHGVDVTLNARTRRGLTVQGGVSTGGGVRDICEVTAKLPEIWTVEQFDACRLQDRWLANWRGLASYTIPRVDVQVSAILRSQATTITSLSAEVVATNGASLEASYDISSSQIAALLGQPYPLNPTDINLARPGQLYLDRVSLVDLRVAKVLRLGAARATVGIDAYNLLNANTVTSVNESFGTDGTQWLRPQGMLLPRFLRFNVTVDF